MPGVPAEGRMAIAYEEVPVPLNGGEMASLRRPTYSVTDHGYGPMAADVMLSPRVAPPMIGLGLLDAVHPGDVLAGADPDDADGDGISGRPNVVDDPDTGQRQLGRFGWKASTPSVRLQTARAFSADIGISTPDVPDPWGDCTARQPACRTKPSGLQPDLGDTEAPEPVPELVSFYSSNLAVPARRMSTIPRCCAARRSFTGRDAPRATRRSS